MNIPGKHQFHPTARKASVDPQTPIRKVKPTDRNQHIRYASQPRNMFGA